MHTRAHQWGKRSGATHRGQFCRWRASINPHFASAINCRSRWGWKNPLNLYTSCNSCKARKSSNPVACSLQPPLTAPSSSTEVRRKVGSILNLYCPPLILSSRVDGPWLAYGRDGCRPRPIGRSLSNCPWRMAPDIVGKHWNPCFRWHSKDSEAIWLRADFGRLWQFSIALYSFWQILAVFRSLDRFWQILTVYSWFGQILVDSPTFGYGWQVLCRRSENIKTP
jgi:hypothetical protein